MVESVSAALRARGAVEVVGVEPPARGSLKRWRQTRLPGVAREMRADALHSFTSAFPLRGSVPVVQTVHEAPWKHGVEENAGWTHRAWARAGRLRAAAVCTPSARVARDLGEHPGLHVVPWGVDSCFGPHPDATDRELLDRYPDLRGGPFILCLDGGRKKKRLDRVLAGAASVGSGTGLRVATTGGPSPHLDALDAKHPGRLIRLGVLDDGVLPALYRAAAGAAILSDSEGFSLPVLEALAAGCHVLVPNDSVAEETAGGAAMGVGPDDPAAVARAMERMLAGDSDLRARGLDRAGSMAWDQTAAALETLWEGIR